MTDFEQVTVQQTCMSCGEEIEAKFSEMTAWQFTKKHTRHCLCSVCSPTSNWKRMIVEHNAETQ